MGLAERDRRSRSGSSDGVSVDRRGLVVRVLGRTLKIELLGLASGVVRTVQAPTSDGTLSVGAGAGGFVDNTFTIEDDGDSTKKLAFQCSGIATGNTRTVTIPDKSGTMAMLDDIAGGSGLTHPEVMARGVFGGAF